MILRKLAIAAVMFGAAYWYEKSRPEAPAVPTVPAAQERRSSDAVDAAFEQRRSNVVVQASGTVSRVLPDDNDGSRHQRFILKLASGRTVLIAHNIDLAPRVDALRSGDLVEFSGEYEWNAQGGVVHWTHRDPQGRHAAGWLRHNGRTYQ